MSTAIQTHIHVNNDFSKTLFLDTIKDQVEADAFFFFSIKIEFRGLNN